MTLSRLSGRVSARSLAPPSYAYRCGYPLALGHLPEGEAAPRSPRAAPCARSARSRSAAIDGGPLGAARAEGEAVRLLPGPPSPPPRLRRRSARPSRHGAQGPQPRRSFRVSLCSGPQASEPAPRLFGPAQGVGLALIDGHSCITYSPRCRNFTCLSCCDEPFHNW